MNSALKCVIFVKNRNSMFCAQKTSLDIVALNERGRKATLRFAKLSLSDSCVQNM
jgi:hypothetical protein